MSNVNIQSPNNQDEEQDILVLSGFTFKSDNTPCQLVGVFQNVDESF